MHRATWRANTEVLLAKYGIRIRKSYFELAFSALSRLFLNEDVARKREELKEDPKLFFFDAGWRPKFRLDF